MHHRSLIITLILALMLLVWGSSCSGERIAGTYTNPDRPGDYLELHKDGTFYSREMGVGFSGEWERKENTLRFHLSDLGLSIEAEFEDGNIVFDQGFEGGREVWTKESRAPQDTSTLKKKLIGRTWKKVPRPGYPGDTVLEFTRDGTVYDVDPETGQRSVRGSYEFVGDKTIRVSADGETFTVGLRITDGSLFMSGGGFEEEYREVSSQTSSRTTGGDEISAPKAAAKWIVSGVFGLAALVTAGLMRRSLRRFT